MSDTRNRGNDWNQRVPKRVLKNMKLPTQRAFKQLKRKQLREMRKVMDELRIGSVYMPEFNEARRLDNTLSRLEEACSVEEWGR